MANALMNALTYLSPVTLLTGCILGLLAYRTTASAGRLIFWYLLAELSLEILSKYGGIVAKNNLFLLPVAGLVDLLFFSVLYLHFFRFGLRVPMLFLSGTAGIAVIISMIFYDTHKIVADFHAYDKLVCDGVVFLYALMSMFDLLKGKGELRQEIFRVNIAVLLYFSLDMLMCLIINFLVNAGLNFLAYFWFLRLALMITLYIILIYTLWQTGKNRKRWQYG